MVAAILALSLAAAPKPVAMAMKPLGPIAAPRIRVVALPAREEAKVFYGAWTPPFVRYVQPKQR